MLLTFETASDLIMEGFGDLKITKIAFRSLRDFVLVGKMTSSSEITISVPFLEL